MKSVSDDRRNDAVPHKVTLSRSFTPLATIKCDGPALFRSQQATSPACLILIPRSPDGARRLRCCATVMMSIARLPCPHNRRSILSDRRRAGGAIASDLARKHDRIHGLPIPSSRDDRVCGELPSPEREGSSPLRLLPCSSRRQDSISGRPRRDGFAEHGRVPVGDPRGQANANSGRADPSRIPGDRSGRRADLPGNAGAPDTRMTGRNQRQQSSSIPGTHQ